MSHTVLLSGARNLVLEMLEPKYSLTLIEIASEHLLLLHNMLSSALCCHSSCSSSNYNDALKKEKGAHPYDGTLSYSITIGLVCAARLNEPIMILIIGINNTHTLPLCSSIVID